MARDDTATAFPGLVNLADAALGAEAVACSDEFFAPKECLLQPGRAVFDPEAYTDRGKLMDGWESRRKRGPGHDWCIIRLGARGVVRAFDIDTDHFLGNHPPYASVEALRADSELSPAQLTAAPIGASGEPGTWTEVLAQVPLRPGTHNLFVVRLDPCWPSGWTHLRLNMFPDGGIARFRVYGDVEPEWNLADVDEETRPRLRPGEVDLLAVRNGGMALAASDTFFGPMYNLIRPGRAVNMGGGWETRRKRGPGFDWIVLRLGAAGSVGLVEVDTNHFKGNAPRSCALAGVMAPQAQLTELVDPALAWQDIVPETELEPHARHFWRDEVVGRGPWSHVRLSIFPDGGISRLRLYGHREERA